MKPPRAVDGITSGSCSGTGTSVNYSSLSEGHARPGRSGAVLYTRMRLAARSVAGFRFPASGAASGEGGATAQGRGQGLAGTVRVRHGHVQLEAQPPHPAAAPSSRTPTTSCSRRGSAGTGRTRGASTATRGTTPPTSSSGATPRTTCGSSLTGGAGTSRAASPSSPRRSGRWRLPSKRGAGPSSRTASTGFLEHVPLANMDAPWSVRVRGASSGCLASRGSSTWWPSSGWRGQVGLLASLPEVHRHLRHRQRRGAWEKQGRGRVPDQRHDPRRRLPDQARRLGKGEAVDMDSVELPAS